MTDGSPQLENGYTKIANEILVALYRFPFSGSERRLVDWVLRDSYGWGRKKTTSASFSVLAGELAMPRASVGLAAQTLLVAGVLLRDAKGCYALNKHHREWVRQGPAELPLTGKPSPKARAALAEAPPRPARVRADRPAPRRAPAAAQAAFEPPTLEQVSAYCAERGGKVNADRWHAVYTANGWMMGRTRMTDWQAGVRSWETNGIGGGGRGALPSRPCPVCGRGITAERAVVCEACIKCRKCGRQTADLVIKSRTDGTKTAWCRDCCKK